MRQVVDAEVVYTPGPWERLVPPAAAFDLRDASEAIRALLRDADTFARGWGDRVPGAFLDALDAVLSLDDWIAGHPGFTVPPRQAAGFRAALIAKGRRLYDQTRGGAVGVVPEAPRMGETQSLTGLLLNVGGLWLLGHWLTHR